MPVFSRGFAPNAPGAVKVPRIQVPITIGDA
jgi:regulator of RNase E activity RraA